MSLLSRLSIWIEHPHRFVREALAEALTAAGGSVVASDVLGAGAEGLPDVILTAVGEGADLEDLRSRWPGARCVALTGNDRQAGASRLDPALTLAGLCALVGLEPAPSPVHHASGPPEHVTAKLGRREREVITLVAAGYTSREIAEQLGIQHGTVERHKRAAVAKLGVSTLNEAVAELSRPSAAGTAR